MIAIATNFTVDTKKASRSFPAVKSGTCSADAWYKWKQTKNVSKMKAFENGVIYFCEKSSILNIIYLNENNDNNQKQSNGGAGNENDLSKMSISTYDNYDENQRQYGHLHRICTNVNDKQFREFLCQTDASLMKLNAAAGLGISDPTVICENIQQRCFDFNANNEEKDSFIITFDTYNVSYVNDKNIPKQRIIVALTSKLLLYFVTIDGVFIRKISLVKESYKTSYQNLIINNKGKHSDGNVNNLINANNINTTSSNEDFSCNIEIGCDGRNVWVVLQNKFLFCVPFCKS